MPLSSTKQRTFKNISYSLVSFAWPVLIALVLTPLLVRFFGVKEYGIYIYISTLLSLVGLLDIGFSGAVSKFIAEKKGQNDKEGLITIFKTANTIFFLIGVVGAVIIATSILLGFLIFSPEVTASYEPYVLAFVYGGLLFFVNSINSLQVIIPSALQRFDIGSKIGLSLITIQQVGVLAVVFFGGSISDLFLLQLLIAIVFYFIYKIQVRKLLDKDITSSLGAYGWSKKEAIRCYTFGIASSLHNLASSSLTYLDRAIIPIFLGPSNLTFYTLPGSITNKIPTLSSTLSAVIFPMTAFFQGEGDISKMRNLYVRSMRLIAIISASVTVGFIAFSYQILEYWIDVNLAEKASDVLIVLAITNCILAMISPLNGFLLGMGKLKAMTATSVVTAILNAVLLVLLLPAYGILGAAWAYLLALLPYVYLVYKVEKEYLGLSGRYIHYLKLFAQIMVTSLLVFLIDILFIKPYITNIFLALIAFGTSSLVFICIHYVLGFFEKEDTYDILTFIRQTTRSLLNKPFKK